MQYLIEGSQSRTTGATAMNNQSSRSHAIFTIYLQRTSRTDRSVFTQHHSVVKNVGCFRRRLFVCGFVAGWIWFKSSDLNRWFKSRFKSTIKIFVDVFVGLCVNTITSEWVNIGWWNLRVGALRKNLGRVRICIVHVGPAFGYDVGKISAGCLVSNWWQALNQKPTRLLICVIV